MKVHQVLQRPVTPLLPHDDVTAVLHHVYHEMSAVVLTSDGQRGEGWDSGSLSCERNRRFSGGLPIRERVTGPALTDSDEEVAPRLGHQQFLCSPAETFTYKTVTLIVENRL